MFNYQSWLAENPMSDKQREALKARFQPNPTYEAETLRRIREAESRPETDPAVSNESHERH